MTVYIDPGIDTDPQDILNDCYTYLQSVLPGWQPSPGQLDVWLLMSMSAVAAESRDVASVVPATIFRWFGANLINLPPIDAAAATVLTKWTMINNAGYTIPAGTQVSIPDASGNPVPFATTQTTVIPSGTTVMDNITVAAVNPGAASSGLGTVNGPVTLIDPLVFVASITQDALTTGGTDAELDEAYLNRLAAQLQLLAPRPILAKDFAVFARAIAGASRATAIDGYNPQHNLLSAVDASLETGLGDWVYSVNATVSQDNTWGADGVSSLKMLSVAAGAMSAVVNPSAVTNVIPAVTPGDAITALATFKPAAARTCKVYVSWYDSTHTFISSAGTSAAVGAGATVTITTTQTAPANAAYASIIVEVQGTAAANEQANVDKMSLRRGTSTDWVPGGTAETNNPRTVTVAAVDANGNPVSSSVKAAIQTDLQGRREVNFIINVVDPNQVSVDVTYTVKALPGYDLPTLVTNINAAISAYMSPSTWGTNNADPVGWTNNSVVRYLKMAQIIEDVDGVSYLSSLVLGPHGGTLAAADFTMAGVAPLPVVGTITGTAN